MRRARDNPFSVERLRRLRYRFRDDDWPSFLDRLRTRGYRGAIVGPKGSGKTTLLDELAAHLGRSGWRVHRLFLNEELRADAADIARSLGTELGSRDIILFDGGEQLGWLSWWRFRWNTRRAGGLIVTVHRRGRLPTVIECRTDHQLFFDVVGDLSGPDWLPRQTLACLYEKHRGNLREALRDLYDLAAEGPPRRSAAMRDAAGGPAMGAQTGSRG